MTIPAGNEILGILKRYQHSFSQKVYSEENNEQDVLMQIFNLTPDIKRQNRQYWGRELGMCWQLIVSALFEATRSDYAVGYRVGADEPCDLIAGNHAIDTKYRIGSGDSGTLKKFKLYGKLLIDKGYEPVFLILREDNLAAAMKACHSGGWTVYTGGSSFKYIQKMTGVDLLKNLAALKGQLRVSR